MRKGFKILFAFFLILIITASLVYVYRGKIVARIVPEIEQLENLEINVLGDTAYVSTTLIAKNKTFLHLKIDSIKYHISFFEKEYLHEEKFLGIDMGGFESDSFDFSLKIPVMAIIKDMKEQRKINDSTTYVINVVIHYSTFLGEADLSLNRSSKIKIPQPPELEVIKVTYDKLHLKSALATVNVRVKNFNDISITIIHMDYTIRMPAKGSVSGAYSKSITIGPKSESYVALPVKIAWDNTRKTLRDIIKNDDTYKYTLTLNATVVSPYPNQKDIVIKIIKDGRMELYK